MAQGTITSELQSFFRRCVCLNTHSQTCHRSRQIEARRSTKGARDRSAKEAHSTRLQGAIELNHCAPDGGVQKPQKGAKKSTFPTLHDRSVLLEKGIKGSRASLIPSGGSVGAEDGHSTTYSGLGVVVASLWDLDLSNIILDDHSLEAKQKGGNNDASGIHIVGLTSSTSLPGLIPKFLERCKTPSPSFIYPSNKQTFTPRGSTGRWRMLQRYPTSSSTSPPTVSRWVSLLYRVRIGQLDVLS